MRGVLAPTGGRRARAGFRRLLPPTVKRRLCPFSGRSDMRLELSAIGESLPVAHHPFPCICYQYVIMIVKRDPSLDGLLACGLINCGC